MSTLTIALGEAKKSKSKSITDRVKSFEDACQELGYGGTVSIEVPKVLDGDKDSIGAYAKLIIIVRALNEGWTPDWNDTNEYKYYPWMEYKSGVGFSCLDFVNSFSGSGVGSRLCFKTRELAEYAAKQFQDLYNEFFNL